MSELPPGVEPPRARSGTSIAAIPLDRIETLFLDAGNTLVSVDFALVQLQFEALGESVDPFGDWPQVDCERFRDVSELQVLLCTARGANSGRRD